MVGVALALESVLEVGIEVFEAQRDEDACCKGYGNGRRAIGLGMISQ